MPELPEVETMRRGILETVGATIESADCPPCPRRPILMEPAIKDFDARVQGRTIEAINRRGKRVLIELDDDQVIVIEPRMTGLVLITAPPTREHLRWRLTLPTNPKTRANPKTSTKPKTRGRNQHAREILFWDRRGLGTVRLLTREEFTERVDAKLGPDALVFTAEHIQSKLRSSRRAVKVALLDQKVVAGIGNLYAAEILFLAGIDPRTRCDKLSGPQWRRIRSCTLAVLNEAIEHEGSTLSDGTYRNALNDPGGYQNCHRVYDRAALPCPRCHDGVIRRIVQAQRSTFFCPKCQRKSGLDATVDNSIFNSEA